MKNRIATLVTAATLLGGCAVGPDYQRPELAVGDTFHTTVSLQQAQSIADIAWLEFFNDPQLTELLRTALANNLDLQATLARLDEAQARLRVARSAYGPSINGQIANSATPGSKGNDATFTGGLVVGWELDIFGKLRRQSEAARAALLASEEGARAVMASLVTGVAASWYQLRELDEEVRVIKRNIATQERSLELVRSLQGSGVASEAEEQQSIAQLAATRAQLPPAEQLVVMVENSLSVLIGQIPQAMKQRPPLADQTEPDSTTLAVGLPTELLERRPDVRQAEHSLHAATAQIGVAMANRFPFPTIGLSGIFGRFSTDVDDLFSSSDSVNLNAWGPTVNLQILDFGAAKGSVDIARAQTRQALAGYRSTVLYALEEVSNSLYRYESAGHIIEQNRIYATAANESLRLQRLRFKSGVVSYLQVLDSERQVLSAELSLARALVARPLAYIDIYRAVGGGWSDEEIQKLREAAAEKE
ncbi:MAG: efflux transporter outer membrane subunit [Parahaliea sp.]